jgi:Fe-S cluster assembly ATP-binding protein
VHVFVAGRVVESGGSELVNILESEGYDRFIKKSLAAH